MIEPFPARHGRRDLDRINRVIAAAIGTWQLPERVKRISLPLYQYRDSDLRHMRLVVARTGESGEIIGLAAVEDADAAEGAGGRAMLLHGIYVDPRYQRMGAGRLLLEAAEAIVLASGASALLVKVQPDAVSFFESAGYEKLPVRDSERDYAYRFWKALRG